MNNIDSLKMLANEIIAVCIKLIDKKNYLMIKTGRIIEKLGVDSYIVEIDKTQYTIKSQFT